jgi:hypothetical protein
MRDEHRRNRLMTEEGVIKRVSVSTFRMEVISSKQKNLQLHGTARSHSKTVKKTN